MDNKWVINISNNEDNWDCSEEFDSKEEAIEYGKDLLIQDRKLPEDDQEYYDKESFDVGQFEQFKPKINAEWVIEEIQDRAYEIGDCGDDYLDDVKKEHLSILDSALNKIFQEWLDKYEYNPNFGQIVNIDTINVEK